MDRPLTSSEIKVLSRLFVSIDTLCESCWSYLFEISLKVYWSKKLNIIYSLPENSESITYSWIEVRICNCVSVTQLLLLIAPQIVQRQDRYTPGFHGSNLKCIIAAVKTCFRFNLRPLSNVRFVVLITLLFLFGVQKYGFLRLLTLCVLGALVTFLKLFL
jgi:hypothetical protein